MKSTQNGRTTMNAKRLVLILSLTLGTGAAVAAIKYGHSEAAQAATAEKKTAAAIPRVVVTASRAQAVEAPVARIVVIGRRADANQAVASRN
jgi:hypothetical protein